MSASALTLMVHIVGCRRVQGYRSNCFPPQMPIAISTRVKRIRSFFFFLRLGTYFSPRPPGRSRRRQARPTGNRPGHELQKSRSRPCPRPVARAPHSQGRKHGGQSYGVPLSTQPSQQEACNTLRVFCAPVTLLTRKFQHLGYLLGPVICTFLNMY